MLNKAKSFTKAIIFAFVKGIVIFLVWAAIVKFFMYCYPNGIPFLWRKLLNGGMSFGILYIIFGGSSFRKEEK